MNNWIKHDGGNMPCHPNAIVEIKISGVSNNFVGYAKNFSWDWESAHSRVIEYRIVEAPREPVRQTRWNFIDPVNFQAGEEPHPFMHEQPICYLDFIDGEPDWSTLRAVK